ncbi:MAG: hypothetical protein AAFR49_20240, partial [Pseudomonadota bacterium]
SEAPTLAGKRIAQQSLRGRPEPSRGVALRRSSLELISSIRGLRPPFFTLFTETGTCVRSSGEKSPQRCWLRFAPSA